MRTSLLTCLICLICLAGCSGKPESGWKVVPVGELSAVEKTRQEEARLMVRTLGQALMVQLMATMNSGDALQAIPVCREIAPKLTAEASGNPGVMVGRTSHRLRNAENRPPVWLTDLEATESRVYRGPNGETGITLPITAKAMCLTCHGPKEGVDADLLAKINEHYPQDQATGFAEGDLRGQFWVELR